MTTKAFPLYSLDILEPKGYKLLNIGDTTIFISRDVIFFGHLFPFHSSFKLGSLNTQTCADECTNYPIPLPVDDNDGSYHHHNLAATETTALSLPNPTALPQTEAIETSIPLRRSIRTSTQLA